MTGLQGGGASQGVSGFIPLIPFVLLFVVFYFLLIRPQQKKQKELQNMLMNLKKGDKVVTVGGVVGAIVDVKDDKLILKIADNVKIEVVRSYVSALIKK
jgi:preprotein translocase subunit YajC